MRILNRHIFKELPANAVYVGRGTFFGNPYHIGEHGDRTHVIARFHDDIAEKLANADPVLITALRGLKEENDLVCSCAPKPCHAEEVAWAWRELHLNGLPARQPSRTYAGIGSRQTPPDILQLMQRIGKRLEERGFTLRSGGAAGADSAFEAGATSHKEIYLPFAGFNGKTSPFSEASKEAFEVAKLVHPAWQALGETARKLQARNSHQVLGQDLRTPSEFVVCWTPAGEETEAERTRDTGGTGQAIALASRWRVPVFNLQRADALERLKAYLEGEYSLPDEPEIQAAPDASPLSISQGQLF